MWHTLMLSFLAVTEQAPVKYVSHFTGQATWRLHHQLQLPSRFVILFLVGWCGCGQIASGDFVTLRLSRNDKLR